MCYFTAAVVGWIVGWTSNFLEHWLRAAGEATHDLFGLQPDQNEAHRE